MAAPGANPAPKWFLNWTNIQEPAGDEGRPWGDESEIAGRKPAGQDPWDTGCTVTPLIGGQHAMTRIATALQSVIAQANAAGPRYDPTTHTWPNGHVYVADWRFNCLRDLSTANSWLMNTWGQGPWTQLQRPTTDQTAIGLVLKLMQAGIQVRLLLWLPHWLGKTAATLKPHVDDHCWAARLVQAENDRLMEKRFRVTDPQAPQLGVVALDMRTADVLAASHHQKLLVIRSPQTNIAFAGGVDLAYTRRDEMTGSALGGDWQSGDDMPAPGEWPEEQGVDYTTIRKVGWPGERQRTDLPTEVYGSRQSWHDQHLVLEGEVVATLEEHFRERWQLDGRCCLRSEKSNGLSGQVILSTEAAFAGGLERLPPARRPVPLAAPGAHTVQMWRTIPLSTKRSRGPFRRGEFTVMAGLANACRKATELIWIFDQFFWSIPLARLLREMVFLTPTLHVVIVLPPHADTQFKYAHQARYLALSELMARNRDRIAVYAMWNPATNDGVYVHAKVQMFDDDLLVCGSANLNRRSFLCDTELAFAVADATLLDAHQQALWGHLFPSKRFPTLPTGNQRTKGWGATLFQEIATATTSQNSKLIPDPWEPHGVDLLNQARRERSSVGFDLRYDRVLDATSVDTAVERGSPTLAKIVDRLENRYRTRADGTLTFPYRKPR